MNNYESNNFDNFNNLLRTEDLHKYYFSGLKELKVLKGVDIQVDKGKIVSLIGASGSGKSTLLNLLGGLDRPTSGKVIYEGHDISQLSDLELAKFRNSEVGFVFQFHHLLSEFTALENVMLPLWISRKNRAELEARATEILKQVGLEERFEHRPTQLSGGEQQRVAIARAIINRPKVVLADEPTGNLDRKTADAVIDLIWQLNSELNQTFVIATHNFEIAQRADKVIELLDGKAIIKKV
jgi:lipoprotein-releasing system ATP-binding protein